MDGLFGDGLVDDILFCGGDSLEEDLHWRPILGALVDLVELEDGVTNDGVALFKIVEAFVWHLCVCRGSKYFKVVSDWLTLVADLSGTISVGRPLWTQSDDVVVLAVVFFALFSRSIGFQIFGNLKNIPLI